MSDQVEDPRRNTVAALREAWLTLTGALSSAETEIQKRLYESLGLPPDASLTAEIVQRVRRNREEFERRIDDGVRSAIARVRGPLDKELTALRQRVENLQEKIDEKLKR